MEPIYKFKFKEKTSMDSLTLNYIEELMINNPSPLKLKWANQFLNYSYNFLKFYNREAKIRYAIENLHLYPIDISKDENESLNKVPGISLLVANRICSLRNKRIIDYSDITLCGGKLYLAKHFICNNGNLPKIIHKPKKDYHQMKLF